MPQILQFLLPKNTFVDFGKKLMLPQNFQGPSHMNQMIIPISTVYENIIEEN